MERLTVPASPTRRRIRRGAVLLAALLAGSAAAEATTTAAGQGPSARAETESVRAAPPAIGAGLDLSISSLQARVKKLEAAQASPDDSTAAAVREYGAAIDQLDLAAEWRRRADALGRLQREGPRLLEATRSEVEAWSRPSGAAQTTDTSKPDMEALLAETEARLAVVRKNLLDLDAEQAQLAERRLTLPAELATAGAVREGMLGGIDLPPLPTGSVEATLAERASLLASRKAVAEQVTALELELSTHETRRELLTARRDLQRRKAEAYTARAAELRGALAEKRAKEAEEAAAEARSDQVSLARVHPILGGLAEENARLTAERTGPDGLGAKIDAATRQLSEVSERLQRLEEHSKGVRQKVAAAGLTDAIGLLLRKERGELADADADATRAEIRVRRDEIAAVQLKVLNLEDLLKNLPAVESEVEGILAAQVSALEGAEKHKVEASAANVLKTRRSYLDALTHDYNSYFASLVDLDAKEVELLRVLEDYGAFLDQHVLWIPNAALPSLLEISDWRRAAFWLVDPRNGARIGVRLEAAARAEPLVTALAALLLASSIVYRRRLRLLRRLACESPQERKATVVPAPVLAVVADALLAAPGPAAVWILGWMIHAAPVVPDEFSRSVAVVLGGLALPWFIAEFLRRAASARGTAAVFLEWPNAILALVRSQIVFAELVALPAFVVAGLLDAQPESDWSGTLGRAAFCLGVGASGLALHRLLSPRSALVPSALKKFDSERFEAVLLRVAWLPSVLAGLVIGIALIGYYYTAFVLTERLWWSSLVLLAFAVADAAALRWLAIQEASPRRDDEGGDESSDSVEAAAITHGSAQTRRLLRVVFSLALLAGLFSVWVDVFPALRFFETIELWQVAATVERTVGSGDASHLEPVVVQVPVTVANLLLALVGAVLAVLGARNIPGLLELALLSRLQLDRGLRYAIATVTRYVVFVVGAVVVLQNLGVGWTNVQWLVAAVSVGLGFGLQEIFGNFVSGLIVLFERPVRVGDMVTIDGVTGIVSRIEIRATTIVDVDRKELIIPNKDLITGKLVNWSLHDPTVRLVIQVGVAYGSDTAAVVRILHEIAKSCAAVLETPAPTVVMTNFGDSALEFELRVFLINPDDIGQIRHELMMEIDRKFRAAAIEIPYPQRDLHLRSVVADVSLPLPGAAR